FEDERSTYVELKDLVIFQKVAEEENISKAAKTLNYVQSNVTARIQRLEEELHTQLFHRHNRGMILTPEGKKLLTYADHITSTVNEMKKVMQDSEMPVGKLDIGTVETVIKLPFILSKYNKRYKHVDVSLTSGVTKELIDQVLHYKLDGAFVTGNHKSAHPDLVQYKVFEEELVLVSAPSYTRIDEIKHKPFLVFSSGAAYRAMLREWLRVEQVCPANALLLGTLESILGELYYDLGIPYIRRSFAQHYESRGFVKCYSLPEKYSTIHTVFLGREKA